MSLRLAILQSSPARTSRLAGSSATFLGPPPTIVISLYYEAIEVTVKAIACQGSTVLRLKLETARDDTPRGDC